MKSGIDNEERVYVIGQHAKHTKKVYLLVAYLTTGILCLISGIYLYKILTNKPIETQGKSLEEIDVISKNAIAPKFMGHQDFRQFLIWIGRNLQYPHGYENEDAEVIVAFTISKDGLIKDIQVLKEPDNHVFGRQVVKLLEKCPRWEPGRLANGKAADIRYTLPVKFSKTRK
jgi:TonB family protein